MTLDLLNWLSQANAIRSATLLLLWGGIWASVGAHAAGSSDWHVEGVPKVTTREVQFANGNVSLAGTLYLPENGDHLSAVVALHSAADATRGAALYRHLREGLPAIGIAVLIYDRRGSGDSSGTLQGVSYETLADDAIAAQHVLAKLPRIDPGKIGFWGLSQGGWLAVLAARRSGDAAFAISVSAPLVTPEQQMEFATANLLTARGYSDADVGRMLDARKAWVDYLRGKGTRAAAVDALGTAETQRWFELAFIPQPSTLTTPEQSTWRLQMDLDPVAAIRNITVPLLFIYGGSDPWIPVSASLQQLRTVAQQQQRITYSVIPGASHEMTFRAEEKMAFDAKAPDQGAPQATAYFMLLASWLCRQGFGGAVANPCR